MTKLGIIVPSTSRGTNWKTWEDSCLNNVLFESFLQTYDEEHQYCFYIGVDHDDPFYTNEDIMKTAQNSFDHLDQVDVQFVKLQVEKGNVVEMWNQLAKIALADHCDYLYQCGDDIKLERKGWVNKCLKSLQEHDDLGMSGPMNRNGNTHILTHCIVSRKHDEIFGFHFPSEIKNWWCDNWINLVYSPDYTFIHRDYPCLNTGGKERYQVRNPDSTLQNLVSRDKKLLETFLNKTKK